MSNDIVARLREEGFITHMAKLPRESKILHAAADEIERLREENKKLMEMKSVEFFQYCKDLWVEKEEADEIERLQDKRDSLLSTNVELEVRIKSIKEGFEGCCTACEPVGEINKKLREERDEARREAMLLLSERSSTKEMNAEYKRRGWEYLKEITNE